MHGEYVNNKAENFRISTILMLYSMNRYLITLQISLRNIRQPYKKLAQNTRSECGLHPVYIDDNATSWDYLVLNNEFRGMQYYLSICLKKLEKIIKTFNHCKQYQTKIWTWYLWIKVSLVIPVSFYLAYCAKYHHFCEDASGSHKTNTW
jgi:hypothetical protein